MPEEYRTNWPFGGETPDTRSHFHETALHEARTATDYREGAQREVAQTHRVRDSFLTRLQLAIAGPAATDACNCPA